MEYAALVDTYEQLDATQSTNEKTAIVAGTLADAAHDDLPMLVQLLRGRLFPAWDPAELGVSSSLASRAIARATGVDETDIEADWRETGDLGSAAGRAVDGAVQQTLFSEALTVEAVYDSLRAVADYEGEGSESRRVDAVAGLLADADPREATYVVRTALGHLRLGVGEGTVRDAIAEAFLAESPDGEPADGEPAPTEADVEAVERALQVTNDAGLVAQTAAAEGRAGLADLSVELYRPLKVMLAEKADSVADALADAGDGPALAEYKVDGFRAQVHGGPDGPRLFTRRLEDVTAQFPDVVEAVAEAVDADSYVVEGEIVGYDPETGDPVPFQQLSRRIKRKHDVERLAAEIPVVIHLFDVIALDGESLLDATLAERVAALERHLTPQERAVERMPNLVSADPDEVESFYEAALAAGHEGIMLKDRTATYQPGRRVGYMLKVKPTMEPLDLVVTRAKYSEGRRANELGRLYLGCRDGETFAEVGRLSTGFTDEQLAEMTERLEARVTSRDGREVAVEPTEVLRVAYEEIQASPEYSSGYALRFPRFEGFRDDLAPEEADSLARLERLYDEQ
jgi:DNA ligase-1